MLNTKIKAYCSPQRLMTLLALGLLIILGMAAPLASAQTVTQGYDADQPLQRGMIVRLKTDDTSKVEPVTTDTAEQTHGIVVSPNDAPVTLSAEGTRVFVASSGQFEVLVSDQNGPVASGDYVSVSALPGIGMKSSEEEPVVIGKALESFAGASDGIGTMDITDAGGNTRTIHIGRVALDIGIGPNPVPQSSTPKVLGFLQQAAEAVTNEPVSAARIYLGLGIFAVAAAVSGSLLYAGIRSGITAIGRNPLSRRVIGKSLAQVCLISLIILLGGVFAVYLVLKL